MPNKQRSGGGNGGGGGGDKETPRRHNLASGPKKRSREDSLTAAAAAASGSASAIAGSTAREHEDKPSKKRIDREDILQECLKLLNNPSTFRQGLSLWTDSIKDEEGEAIFDGFPISSIAKGLLCIPSKELGRQMDYLDGLLEEEPTEEDATRGRQGDILKKGIFANTDVLQTLFDLIDRHATKLMNTITRYSAGIIDKKTYTDVIHHTVRLLTRLPFKPGGIPHQPFLDQMRGAITHLLKAMLALGKHQHPLTHGRTNQALLEMSYTFETLLRHKEFVELLKASFLSLSLEQEPSKDIQALLIEVIDSHTAKSPGDSDSLQQCSKLMTVWRSAAGAEAAAGAAAAAAFEAAQAAAPAATQSSFGGGSSGGGGGGGGGGDKEAQARRSSTRSLDRRSRDHAGTAATTSASAAAAAAQGNPITADGEASPQGEAKRSNNHKSDAEIIKELRATLAILSNPDEAPSTFSQALERVLALAKPDTHNDNPQQRLQALNQMSPTFRGFTMLMRIQSALGTVLAASFLSLSSADQKLLINTLDPSPGPDTTTDLMQAALLMSDWYSEAKRQRARAAAQAVRLAARRNHTGLGPHAVAQGATTPQPSTTSGS